MPTAPATDFTHAVIDASVAVKWFSIETDTNRAERLLEQAHTGSLTLHAPDLLVAEVMNALWKGKHMEEPRILAALDMLLSVPLTLVRIEARVATLAVSLMHRYDLTFYDAIYAGLASSLGIPLLSANPRDHEKIDEITVIDLSQLSPLVSS